MAVLPVGFGEAAIHYRRTSDPGDYVVTFGFSLPAPATAQEVADSIAVDWNLALPATHFNSGTQLYSANVGIQTEGLGIEQGVSIIGAVGTASGQMTTQNCAQLVKKVTARSGRRGRGRMFLPYVMEDNVNDIGMLTPTWQTAINTALLNLLGYLAGTSHGAVSTPMHLLHSPGSTSTPLPDLVTSMFIDPLIGTQRRRLR